VAGVRATLRRWGNHSASKGKSKGMIIKWL
jgi:hypothetical protein